MYTRSKLVGFSRGRSNDFQSKLVATELQTDDIDAQVLTEP